MAASNANASFGIQLKVGDGADPEVFTDLAEVRGLPGVGATNGIADVTHFGSPNGWREKIATGIKEGKAFTVPLNFVADDTQQIALIQTKFNAGSVNNYQVAFNDGGTSTLTFGAIISDFTLNHNIDDAAMADVQFTPDGAFTWA